MTDEEFLNKIDAFRNEHKIKPTTFGKLAMNDAKFLGRLQGGGSVTLKTANRVIGFMEQYNNS